VKGKPEKVIKINKIREKRCITSLSITAEVQQVEG